MLLLPELKLVAVLLCRVPGKWTNSVIFEDKN